MRAAVFNQILKRLGQGLLGVLGDEAVAQRLVAIVVAEGDRAQFVDEVQPQIGVLDILFQTPVGGSW